MKQLGRKKRKSPMIGEKTVYNYCLAVGGLGFWFAGMLTMPHSVPICYRLLSVAFMWIITGTVLSRKAK
jgi:hypothetical protein